FAPAEGLRRGGYVLAEAGSGEPKAIIMATGSEVSLALEARTELESSGIPTRVVSMPSWALFDRQSPDYRASVLPRNVRARVSIEAASPMGWHRWVGDEGATIAISRFGDSAPAQKL